MPLRVSRDSKFMKMKIESLLFSCALMSMGLTAAPLDPVTLWPDQPPGPPIKLDDEKDTTTEASGKIGGKWVIRLGNVSQPTMTVYPAKVGSEPSPAVVVAPGGGYSILAMDLEGTEVCDWLNSIGVTAVLLKYRVPARPGSERAAAPLQDIQRAIGLVRQSAPAWKIDPKRVGVLGFSAGGHLAALACNQFEKRSYPRVDSADDASARPDFAILIYPAYLTKKEQKDQLAEGFSVSSNTPPTFLVQTQDDSVPVETSLYYFAALQRAKVPAELHIYPRGGHGYGLRPSTNFVSHWPKRAEEWMGSMGFLNRR